MTQESERKDQTLEDLLRDKQKLENQKCNHCMNGEKIPDKVLSKMAEN